MLMLSLNLWTKRKIHRFELELLIDSVHCISQFPSDHLSNIVFKIDDLLSKILLIADHLSNILFRLMISYPIFGL